MPATAADSIEHFPATDSPDASWGGVGMLTGGKGYVEAPLGQIHYRDVGPRDAGPPLLLLHQSPQSMVEFGAVQNLLAARGIRSLAPDTPGYGMSDQPTVLPTIGGLADNFVALLDALDVPAVVACGHHTGAAIAAALAARHPHRVSAVVLHGCPLYTADDAERARAAVLWDCTPKADGSHLSQLFKWKNRGTAGEFLNLTWMSIGLFQQGRDLGHWAVNRYDMAADLVRIAAPGLVITEVDDMTHAMDARVSALRPDFHYEIVSDRGNTMVMTAPERWVSIVSMFLETIGTPAQHRDDTHRR